MRSINSCRVFRGAFLGPVAAPGGCGLCRWHRGVSTFRLRAGDRRTCALHAIGVTCRFGGLSSATSEWANINREIVCSDVQINMTLPSASLRRRAARAAEPWIGPLSTRREGQLHAGQF